VKSDRRVERLLSALFAIVPIGFAIVFVIWPLAAILARGFVADGPTLGPLVDLWSSPRSRSVLEFTFVQAVWSTVVTFMVGLPAAWAVSREWFGRSFVRVVTGAAFVLPTVVVALAWRSVVDRGLTAIVLAHVSFNVAIVVQILGTAWSELDPSSEEAARTLGSSPGGAWRSVVLPRLAPSATAAAVLTFLFSFTSYGVVVVLGNARQGTIETEVARAVRGLDFERAGALAVVQLVIVMTTLAIGGWLGQVIPTNESGRRRPHRRPWAAALAVVPALGIVLVPISTMARRVAAPGGSPSFDGLRILTADDLRIEGTPLDSIVTSLRFGLIAAAVATAVGALVVSTSTRSRSRGGARWSRLLDSALMVPLGVSAVTLGYGYLITFDEAPLRLRDRWWIVPLAHAVVAIPFVVRVLTPARRALDRRVTEVARTLGASSWVLGRTVTLPMLAPAIGVAIGFAAAISIGEFGATSMLARRGVPTAPFAIGQLAGTPGDRTRLASDSLALALATVALAVMGLAQLPGRRRAR
jgi:thiamine transport system permease protein